MKITEEIHGTSNPRVDDMMYLCFEFVRLVDDVRLLVEDDDGELMAVGCVGQLKDDPKTALIHFGMVHPNHRRKGIHTMLMEKRIQMARDRGCTRCVATSYGPETNSARNLKRFGFREEAWLPHGPFDATTEWVLDLV